MADRTVMVRLKADTAQYDSKMRSAAGSMSSFDKAQEASQKRAQRWRAVGAASTVAGAAIAAGLFKATKSASDLGESVNAVNVTFGTASKGILGLGDAASQAVGLSKTEFNGLAVRFSAFAQTVAGDGGDVVSVMDDLTTRAADFASVMDLEVGEAAELFQSGLAGESEPLRKYGIDISAATVETYAYANGIAEAGATLTEAQKIQARYGSIMEQTAKTHGDFANTSDSAANASRIAKAEFENAAAALGEALLPAMASAASAAAELLESFNELPGPTKTAVGYFAALAGGALILGPRIVSLASGLLNLKNSLGAACGASKAKDCIGGLAPKAGMASSAISSLGGIIASTFGTGALAIGAATGAVGLFAGAAVATAIGIKQANDASGVFGERLTHVTGQTQIATASVDELDRAAQNSIIGSFYRDAADAATEAGQAVASSGPYADESARAWARDAQAKVENAAASRQAMNANYALLASSLALSGSKDALLGRTKRLTDAVEENGKKVLGHTSAAVANRRALDQEFATILSLADARRKDAEATSDAASEAGKAAAGTRAYNQTLRNQIPALVESANAAGLSKKETRDYVASLLRIPKSKVTKILADGAKKSKKEVDDHNKAASEVPKSKSTKVDSPGAKNAKAELEEVRGAAEAIPGNADVDVRQNGADTAISKLNSVYSSAVQAAGTYYVDIIQRTKKMFADGGLVRGPGTGTSDSIPARLSNGEFVVSASAVDRYGVGFLAAVNEERFAAGGPVGKKRDKAKKKAAKAQRQQEDADVKRADREGDVYLDVVVKGGVAYGDMFKKGGPEGGMDPAQIEDRWLAADRRIDAQWTKTERVREDNMKRFQRVREQGADKLRRKEEEAENILARKRDKMAGDDGKLSEAQKKKLRGSDEWKARKKAHRETLKYERQTEDRMTRRSRTLQDRDQKKRYQQQDARRRAQRREAEAEEARQKAEAEREGVKQMLIADAAEAAAARRQAAAEAESKAEAEHDRLLAEKASFIERISDSLKSNLSVLGAFDFTKHAGDAEAVANAEEALAEAQKALVTASGASRADARKALAEARKNLAEAQKAEAESKATPENILKSIQGRVAQAQEFSSLVQGLQARGLDQNLINDLAGMDPKQAMDLLRAYSSMSASQLAQVNAANQTIGGIGDSLGAVLGRQFDTGIQNAADALAAAKLEVTIAAAPVTVNVDGQAIANALIEYQRRTGTVTV